MLEKWTNTSLPSSREMNPWPFSALNNLTVPAAMVRLPICPAARTSSAALRRRGYAVLPGNCAFSVTRPGRAGGLGGSDGGCGGRVGGGGRRDRNGHGHARPPHRRTGGGDARPGG